MAPAPRIVQDVETLKALADPGRLAMLELMMSDQARTWTAKELAAAIQMPLKKIYYHLGLLEQRGLLHVRDTAVVNGIIEKHYAASQESIRFQHGAASAKPGPGDDLGKLVTTLLDDVEANILKGLSSGRAVMHREAPDDKRVVISYSTSAMSPEQAGRFRSALLEVIEEFQATSIPGEPRFELLVTIGPRVNDPNPAFE